MLNFVPKATIDHNAIVALDKRANGEQLSAKDLEIAIAMDGLISLANAGKLDIVLAMISANERQKDGVRIGNVQEFKNKLQSLGIEPAIYSLPEFRLSMSFLGYAKLGFKGPEWKTLQHEIKAIIHPTMDWNDVTSKNWLNRYCDVATIHAHFQANADIFITDDNHFLSPVKKSELLLLGANRIETAKDALTALSSCMLTKAPPLNLPKFDTTGACTYIPPVTFSHYREFRRSKGLPPL